MVKSKYWDESLQVQHLAYIQSPSVKAAFDILVDTAIALPGLVSHPDMDGKIREFRYLVRDSDHRPFSFVVNFEDLVFYVHKNGQAEVKGGFPSLRRQFDTARTDGNGRWIVKITNAAEALALKALLFPLTELADHYCRQSDQLEEEIAAILTGLIPDGAGSSSLDAGRPIFGAELQERETICRTVEGPSDAGSTGIHDIPPDTPSSAAEPRNAQVEVGSAEIIEAFLYLVHADDSVALQQSICRITENWGHRPTTFSGHLASMNALVSVGIKDPEELLRIFELVQGEREGSRNRSGEGICSGADGSFRGSQTGRISSSGRRIYQKELMRQRRWRLASAQELHELRSRKKLQSEDELEQFCRETMKIWREAKHLYLKQKGGAFLGGTKPGVAEFLEEYRCRSCQEHGERIDEVRTRH